MSTDKMLEIILFYLKIKFYQTLNVQQKTSQSNKFTTTRKLTLLVSERYVSGANLTFMKLCYGIEMVEKKECGVLNKNIDAC